MNRAVVAGTDRRLPAATTVLARLALVGLVVGVPVVLTTGVGGPSTHLDVGAIWRAAQHHRPADARLIAGWIGRIAVWMAWIAWAWLIMCVVLELRAWLTGGSTVRLPASRSMQWVAAVLVGTAFAVGTSARAHVHVATPSGIHAPLPIGAAGGPSGDPSSDGVGIDDPPPSGDGLLAAVFSVPAAPGPAIEEVAIPELRHVVARRETLWSIAQDRLGDARRWRAIAELNYGVVQADGACLATDHWIQAGWELDLPRDLIVSDVLGTPAPPGSSPSTSPRSPGASVATRRLPIEGAPVAPVGAGIVGVGVADIVDRLRKVQQRHRAVGSHIRLPEPVLRAFEQRLRAGGGRAELDAVESAVEMWFAAADSHLQPTVLRGAVVTELHVELLLAAPPPDPVPAPFFPGDDPVTVRIERAALAPTGIRRRVARESFPAPSLVAIGRSSDHLVMVNLEDVGSLVLRGESMANEEVWRALATELATSRWAAAFDLVVVGKDAGLAPCERVLVAPDAAGVIADLSWRRLRAAVRLEELGLTRADVARRGDGGRQWDPLVVVCGPTVPSTDVEALVALAEDGRSGIAVVATCGPDHASIAGALELRPGVEEPAASVDLFGNAVHPQRLCVRDADQVAAVIEQAMDLDPADGVDEVEAGDMTFSPPFLAPAAESSAFAGHPAVVRRIPVPVEDDGAEIEVAVLGPVEIRGAARPLTRAWATELVVYLALHPSGATNDTWVTALWPERRMAPSSIHSTVSVARRALGASREGTDHLPRSHGRLALSSTVRSDWARFQELATSDEPERWQAALSVVRGRPFDGLRSTDWTILDGTLPAIESTVVDLAGRLSGVRLRAGDSRGAEWAARQGLLVCPYDERLYRMLLRAADAAGNPGGVEAVMAELVRVVADEIEPIESVHPSTLALYRSLSRRPDGPLWVPAGPRAS